MACGVIAGLSAHGVSVPGDFSVIGCDDVLISRLVTPPLTTVAAPIGQLGTLAVDLLGEVIAEPHRTPRVRTLRGALVDRDTTAGPPGRLPAYLR